MKLACKSIVVGAVVVLAGGANAALVTVENLQSTGFSGYGALTLSDNMRNALNAGSISTLAFGSAVAQVIGEPGIYTKVSVSTPVNSLTYDDVTGQVVSLRTMGGIRQEAALVEGVVRGGWVEIGNLDVNLQTKEIFGTIEGQSLAGVTTNFSGKLFDFASFTGSSSFMPGTSTTKINTLSLTPQGFAEIKKSLDLQFLGAVSQQAASSNYGDLTFTFSFGMEVPMPPTQPPAIPEPSTYALMGLGLLGLAYARRRASK